MGSIKKVDLLKCSKRSCEHVFTDLEFDWIPGKFGSKKAVCPKCGCDSFWGLNKAGQAVNDRPSINPEDIEPSSRMGLKMRRRIFAAKRRALELLTN